MIDRFDRRAERIPGLQRQFRIAVAPVEPDDVGFVLVAFGDEAADDRRGVGVEQAIVLQISPDRHQRQIQSVRSCAVDHPVEMVPIIIFTGLGRIIAGRDARTCQVAVDESRTRNRAGHLRLVQHHYLDDIVSLALARCEVAFGLFAVEFAEQQPAGVAQPKKRFSPSFEVAPIGRHGQARRAFLRVCRSQRAEER